MNEEMDVKSDFSETIELIKGGLEPYKRLSKTQVKILDAARELFSTKGFENSSTMDIAKLAGVAEITLFRNFKSKTNLLFQLLAPAIAKVSMPTKINKDKYLLPEEAIKDIILERVRAFKEHNIEMTILLSESIYHEEVRRATKEFMIEPLKSAMRVFIQEKVNEGYFRNVDIDATIDLIYYSVLGFIINYYLLNESPESENVEELVRTYLQVLLKGLFQHT
ncbi:TetR/AcrR family transcriptional regulator [Alkalihalobacillus pseudalcaliphilus]|uniref:TetR/AcrR family transcriptional regulator n=1 Tax=Alkalihalobacillus pseudalcaliphilus TaxID=79884 RepID=UPI00064DE344|nr:TetR/AcrR family transcriptional regulator [Alkalihalobacillus pseudalcaliphilus]KMK75608.1 hypothetical protein AB990_09990 [Alkalihalobacillus pseudalcaliphilus]